MVKQHESVIEECCKWQEALLLERYYRTFNVIIPYKLERSRASFFLNAKASHIIKLLLESLILFFLY